MKKCTKCQETKKLNSFSKDKYQPDGKKHWCKSCANTCTFNWKANNPEKVIQYQLAYNEVVKTKRLVEAICDIELKLININLKYNTQLTLVSNV